ncbi:MAG: hypothetical protein OEV42_11195 [Deltaproteobacteria bacterium]|nr:hypothetical protein [Deltaproteobacteria bacterium]
MKRPKGVYLVAVWLFLGAFGLSINPVLRILLLGMIENPKTIQIIQTLLLVFIIYLIIGIIKLKPTPTQIIISSIIMSLVSIYQLYAIITFLMFVDVSKKTLIITCWKLFLIISSIAAIIYLNRKNFREYAKEFLAENNQAAMLKFIQKK